MTSTRTIGEGRETLLRRLIEARRRTDEIFERLVPEALTDRPVPERHRMIFYLGHLEAFDWNLLSGPCGLESFHPEFDRLFAFGIDPTDGGLPDDPPSAWPSEGAIRDYNARVREGIDRCFRDGDPAAPGMHAGALYEVALEHRLMHAETLAYLLHQVPHERKRPPSVIPPVTASAQAPRRVRVAAGTATLGLPREAGVFGWDNEFGEHAVEVGEFEIDVFDVTNGQFRVFVEAGGYRDPKLWTEGDWRWREGHGITHPAFWVRGESGWKQRGMFQMFDLPETWSVYVSLAEARAFARWAGGRLPTEAEFHRAAYGSPEGGESAYPWGDEAPTPRHGNFDFRRWDATPVGAYPQGNSAWGVADLVGNGWEWTATEFAPLPGFTPFPFYKGYSADFFDGDHFVIKGGSPRTAAALLRRSFRNWFQPRYQYVYATFRLVTP